VEREGLVSTGAAGFVGQPDGRLHKEHAMKNGMVDSDNEVVLCYGGPRHGEWLETPKQMQEFRVAARLGWHEEGFINPTVFQYVKDNLALTFAGVDLEVRVAICVDRLEKAALSELAQFAMGCSIARLMTRPETLRLRNGDLVGPRNGTQ
jgi:hypothetical protein